MGLKKNRCKKKIVCSLYFISVLKSVLLYLNFYIDNFCLLWLNNTCICCLVRAVFVTLIHVNPKDRPMFYTNNDLNKTFIQLHTLLKNSSIQWIFPYIIFRENIKILALFWPFSLKTQKIYLSNVWNYPKSSNIKLQFRQNTEIIWQCHCLVLFHIRSRIFTYVISTLLNTKNSQTWNCFVKERKFLSAEKSFPVIISGVFHQHVANAFTYFDDLFSPFWVWML